MKTKPDRSAYTAIDFIGWHEAGSLALSPKFQRRQVWSTPARSFLIDSVLLGMPIPPIYIRVVQNAKRSKVIREVVDGQQRITAVLDYVAGKFALSKNIESPVAGLKFEELDESDRNQILQYSFICEVFHGIGDAEVLSVFARLNTHSVKLNAQELRNGRWFGQFKQLSYGLALEQLEFWKGMRVFSDGRIARMMEVELTSELLILGIAGLQDKKKSIDDFYEEYDVDFMDRKQVGDRFRKTIDAIVRDLGSVLRETEFRRPPLFYSLYGAVYHRLFGIPNCDLPRPRNGKISAAESESLVNAVRTFSEFISIAKQEDEDQVPKKYRTFISACLRQTDNVKPRKTRLDTFYQRAFLFSNQCRGVCQPSLASLLAM